MQVSILDLRLSIGDIVDPMRSVRRGASRMPRGRFDKPEPNRMVETSHILLNNRFLASITRHLRGKYHMLPSGSIANGLIELKRSQEKNSI